MTGSCERSTIDSLTRQIEEQHRGRFAPGEVVPVLVDAPFVAAVSGMCEASVRRAAYAGKLRSIKKGRLLRFTIVDVAEWLAKGVDRDG